MCAGGQRPLYAERPVNMLPASKLQVAEVTCLLHQWPKLAVEKALELLDYAYADQAVRHFAVQCLRDVR